jgi:hypothetical protein
MSDRSTLRTIGVVALASAAIVGAYVGAVLPRISRWGASDDEIIRPLPGDDLVRNPKVEATRAVTVEAPPADVWPWLLQIGLGRGGLYSYDFLENLIRLDLHSVDRVVPEFQDLKVGDVVRIMPGEGGFRVVILEPTRALVLYTGIIDTNAMSEVGPEQPTPASYFSYSWAFALEPIDERKTRLIVRSRTDYSPGVANTLIWRVITEPASFVMERGMLLGIKQRAEALARQA